MKVTDASEIRPLSSNKQTAEPDRPAAKDAAASPDKVSVEQSARLDAALASVRRSLGASRSAKLEAIEAAVRQGTYRPDPQRIAQQILNEAELSAALQAMLKR